MKFDNNNFTYRAFIDYVLTTSKLTDLEEPIKTKIEKEMMRLLDHRIMGDTINAMTKDNIMRFEILKDENPHMALTQIIFSMAEEIPLLHEVVMKSVNSVADELVYDAERIQHATEDEKSKLPKSKK